MPKKKRRRFTAEFKAAAAELVIDGGKTIAEVARQLGISETSVNRWVAQARVDAAGPSSEKLMTSEREELARLRRENKRLKMERDFLKKATVFFAKESQ